MVLLLFASAVLSPPGSEDPALDLCKPMLARKAGGEIATIGITSVKVGRHGRTIEGQLTAFVGMAPAPPGSASTHHLIRSDFTYKCRVHAGRVRQSSVNPVGG